jgi:hypothetical protein
MPDTVSNEKGLLVFLSHASQDKVLVRELCEKLKNDGFDPWLDEERLFPGMDWNLEIEQALRASDVILLCFSSISVEKEGYIQREYKRAMRYKEEKPEGAIYVIPVKLDDCKLPNFIQEVQWVDYPDGYDRLIISLNLRNKKLSSAPPTPVLKKEENKPSGSEKPTGGINFHAQKVEIGGDIVNGSKYVFGRESVESNSLEAAFKKIQRIINDLPEDPEIDKSYIRLFVEDIQKEVQKAERVEEKKLISSLKLLQKNSEVIYLLVVDLFKSQDFNIAPRIRELVS